MCPSGWDGTEAAGGWPAAGSPRVSTTSRSGNSRWTLRPAVWRTQSSWGYARSSHRCDPGLWDAGRGDSGMRLEDAPVGRSRTAVMCGGTGIRVTWMGGSASLVALPGRFDWFDWFADTVSWTLMASAFILQTVSGFHAEGALLDVGSAQLSRFAYSPLRSRHTWRLIRPGEPGGVPDATGDRRNRPLHPGRLRSRGTGRRHGAVWRLVPLRVEFERGRTRARSRCSCPRCPRSRPCRCRTGG